MRKLQVLLIILTLSIAAFGQTQSSSDKSYKKINKEIEDYTKAIELNPNDPKLYIKRGTAYYVRVRYDKALNDFNKAVELAPDSANVYVERGGFYSLINKNDLAIADYTKAIELDPKNIEAFEERGFAYKRTKNYEKAVADFTETIKLEPENRLHYINRGVMYEKTGKLVDALNDYSSAVAYDQSIGLKKSHAVYYRRGLINITLEEYKAALEDFNRAIKINPVKNKIYFQRRAEVFCKLGEKEKAEIDEKMVIELGGKITKSCK